MTRFADQPIHPLASDKDLADQARRGHGVPSQDPDPAAQVALEPHEAEREARSVLMGGGAVSGAATGAAIGAAVAGPMGVLVGAPTGALAGALAGAAAGAAANPDGADAATADTLQRTAIGSADETPPVTPAVDPGR